MSAILFSAVFVAVVILASVIVLSSLSFLPALVLGLDAGHMALAGLR